MLDEGRRRVERGTDVVVGYVETHGRPKTERGARGTRGRAAREGRLPRHRPGGDGPRRDPRAAPRRGPGRRAGPHQRAGQRRTRSAGRTSRRCSTPGIEVITTVNIQHLESLNDVTEPITGVRQRETVPDHVVRSADQIELVDMSPQALRRRMAHGNIYAADKIDAALSQLLPRGQPHRAARAGPAVARRPRRRGPRALPRAARDRLHVGHPRAHRRAGQRRAGVVHAHAKGRADRLRRSGGEWLALYVTRQDGLTGIAPDQLTRLARQGRGAGRHLPHRRRRRPGRRDPRLRPCRERHPGRDRRQPPWPGLDPAAARRRRARDRRVGRHRRPHRHPRLRRPGTAATCRRHPRPAPPSDRACLRGAGARAAEPGAPPDQGPARPAHRGDVADGRRGRDGAHRRARGQRSCRRS